jgi:hypothetical protein
MGKAIIELGNVYQFRWSIITHWLCYGAASGGDNRVGKRASQAQQQGTVGTDNGV